MDHNLGSSNLLGRHFFTGSETGDILLVAVGLAVAGHPMKQPRAFVSERRHFGRWGGRRVLY
jgi:hypothetical protein